MKAQIIKTIYIEAAYRVCSMDGQQELLSGNSYRIDIIAEGEISSDVGWVIDYADMKAFFEPIRQKLDHHCLNDVPGLENYNGPQSLQQWILEQLRPWPSWFVGVRVFPPSPTQFTARVVEGCPVSGLPTRLAFDFSAAQSLPQLPVGHPCRELHGHTYTIEMACKNMDKAMLVAEQIFGEVHGKYLNRIPGLEQATAERIAVWIWQRLVTEHMEPIVVGVQETPQNRCYYYGY